MSEEAKIAKASVDIFIRYGKTPVIKGGCIICDDEHFQGQHLTQKVLQKNEGIQVELFCSGMPRGKMASPFQIPQSCIAQDIVRFAISASCQDPTQKPIDISELGDLLCRVTVITGKNLVPFENLKEFLDSKPTARGIFLQKEFCQLMALNIDGDQNFWESIPEQAKKNGLSPEQSMEIYELDFQSYT